MYYFRNCHRGVEIGTRNMNRDKKMGKSRERKYGLQDICLIVYNFNIVTESGRNSIVICNLADEYKKRVVFLGIYYKIYLY